MSNSRFSPLDFFIALVLAPSWVTLTVVAIIMLVVENPQLPTIFIQERIGYNGRPFYIFKLRTMIDGKNVTPTGFWLRKTHIDELPQFVNVLLGQMRIIGPRPLTRADCEKFRDQFGPEFDERFLLYPGITGEEQLLGRSRQQAETVDSTKRLRQKIEASRGRMSLLYLKYIFETVRIMAKKNGSPV